MIKLAEFEIDSVLTKTDYGESSPSAHPECSATCPTKLQRSRKLAEQSRMYRRSQIQVSSNISYIFYFDLVICVLRYIFSYQAPPKRCSAQASEKTLRMSGFSQLFKIKTSSVFNLAFVTLGIASSTTLFPFSSEIFQSVADHTINGQKEFAIVVPTYNNSRFCIANIESLVTQQYNNYHVYIVNDASTDETYEKLYNYIIDHACEDLVTLINNSERVGALANYYAIITSLPDHVIVLNVDGDDWLAHEEVLSTLNRVYDDHDIWLTYGQFRQYPSGEIGFCRSISHDVIEQHNYRRSEWLSTHLRTYYAWLFKRIDVNDLYYDGHFMRACGDRALMYPMLEMCAGHFACINDVLYSYNCANPLADVRVNLKEQQKMCHYICSLKPYAAIDGLKTVTRSSATRLGVATLRRSLVALATANAAVSGILGCVSQFLPESKKASCKINV